MKEELTRCDWPANNAEMIHYHDTIWGVPVHDDIVLFEYLTLGNFQAGLSWMGVYKKRENFLQAFDGFDFHKIAKYDDARIGSLMQDAGIIRNLSKIKAVVNNAQKVLEVIAEYGSFDKYIWQFTDGKSIITGVMNLSHIAVSSSQSDIMSKDMKKRGFKFVGSVICYAFMQAAGMINDHQVKCFRFSELQNINKYI
jgi:DNA-3-methyladenine glycosylase I